MERTVRRTGQTGDSQVTLTLYDLKQMGAAAGFDIIGATTAADFPELVPVLQDYERRGTTGFESGNVTLRSRPTYWMPEARSLISVAMAYLTPAGWERARRHPRDHLTGQVSLYSYGEDYHRVMKRRLQTLQTLLEQHLGHPILAKTAVDTSPLVDRRVAERAGIGWIGKNCMFYAPKYGSYVFLGTLVTNLDFHFSEPAGEHTAGENTVGQRTPAEHTAGEWTAGGQSSRCGRCTLCLQACPTQALIAPGVIDATRCLSYVTQMQGIIPEALRKPLGRRVWGCDTCQLVCPENRGISYSEHQEYLPGGELEYPRLLEILQWSHRGFARRYGHTAAAWRGVRVWQRNALIAIGNCGQRGAIPHVIPFLSHERYELRASAAWALRQIGSDQGRRAVAKAYAVEGNSLVRQEMRWAIAT